VQQLPAILCIEGKRVRERGEHVAEDTPFERGAIDVLNCKTSAKERAEAQRNRWHKAIAQERCDGVGERLVHIARELLIEHFAHNEQQDSRHGDTIAPKDEARRVSERTRGAPCVCALEGGEREQLQHIELVELQGGAERDRLVSELLGDGALATTHRQLQGRHTLFVSVIWCLFKVF
jgi:hypothetical protein